MFYEKTLDLMKAFDDKYSHLPGDGVSIRRDLDDHGYDLRLHSRSAAPARRAARKARAR